MEDNKLGGTSDRDRKMMGSFEGYADKSDDDDEKDNSKKSKKEARPSLFEAANDDKKVEKNQPDDDKPERDNHLKLDKLSNDENKQVVEQYAEARAEDLKEDLAGAQPDSLEEAIALANAALIESIQEHEAATEDDLDAALNETIDELGLEDAEADDSDDETTAATTTPAAGGAGTPPPPPVPPAPPASPPTPPPTGGSASGALPPRPAAPNIIANTPNTTEADDEAWRVNRRRAGQLLMMAGVGYLLGRRRGRINTEKQLVPVQERLEKEVKTLHDQVAEREEKIRRLAAEKVLSRPETVRPQLIDRVQARVERRLQPVEITARRPETLGKFVLPGAEVVRGIEVKPKSFETMTIPEILVIASRIERDGISVKNMYETGRLDAVGLRRVVKEYLEGAQLDRVLAENLREIESFEGQPLSPQTTADQMAAGSANSPVAPAPAYQFNAYQPPVPPTRPVSVQPPQDQNILAENKTAIAAGVISAIIILLLIVLFGR